jgi:hypothetical protein
MIPNRPGTTRYRSLEASGRVLARSAGLVRLGVFSIGVALFLDQVRALISDAQFTWGERRVMGIVGLVTLGGFGLAGWLAGRVMRATAELIEVFIDGADAATRSSYLIEAQVAPALVRAAAALERLAEASPAALPNSNRAAAVRRAILEGRWGRAEQLLDALTRDTPAAPELSALAGELARARQAEIDDLRSRLEAARATDDPERVIACRDALTQHLRGSALEDLDRRVVRWLADLIQKRARAGSVSPDVPALAERVADSFGDTSEAAALLAALPNLRRRAGLCPRCGRPYPGSDDACPACRAQNAGSTPRPLPGGAVRGGKT